MGGAAYLQGCEGAVFKQDPYCFLQDAVLSKEGEHKQKACDISEQWMKF